VRDPPMPGSSRCCVELCPIPTPTAERSPQCGG
jgi:hypothetical protein